MNRQTHLKKTKGSNVPFKERTDSDNTLILEEEEEDLFPELDLATSPTTQATTPGKRWSKLKPQKSDLRRKKTWTSIKEINVELDDELDDEVDFVPPALRRDSNLFHDKEQSLFEIAQKVKVFSHLGVEAMTESLTFAEYVDVPLGETLFERGKFDGSLLVVVSGRIQCRFHEYPLEDDEHENEENVLGFTSGPGDVVTPLLGLLSALVWAQQEKDNPSPSESSSHPQEPLAIASGVSAIATAENTRLIRIPPTSFAHILEKFPSDVYRVAQTILSRTQRVTLQTLVKTLGLHKELIVGDASLWEGKEIKEKRLQMPEWQRIETSFQRNVNVESLETADLEAIQRDAAIVAAFELNVPVEEAQIITENSSIISINPGETLIHTGLPHDAIYLLLSGSVEVGAIVRRNYYSQSQSPYFYRYHNVEAGTLLGRLACFAGDVSMIEVRARRESEAGTGCILLKIPKSVFDDLIIRHPRAMIRCMQVILGLISPVVTLLNWNSEWLHVEPSEAIAHKGDRCDSIFMVLNGRLRASHKDAPVTSPATETVEEYGRGKFIGEVFGLTDSRWQHDVYALRNSELVRVPIDTLLSIIRAYPTAGVHFAAVIASQVQNKLRHGRSFMHVPAMKSLASSNGTLAVMPSYGLNLATIAVVPLSPLDVAGFCSEFVSALNEIAPAALLEKSDLRKVVGEKTFQPKNAMHEMKMTRFLGDMEEKHRLVVYRADFKYTWWTQLAITQADCILLLVRADEIPEKHQVEQCLAWAHESMGVRIELVVISEKANIDEEYSDVLEEVDDWTENREWVTGSQRIRSPFDHHGLDFKRMCRRITGRSVGLALGGGGARGIAHLGIIRALMEAGVTVDMVGGTSQGAYIGALYAESPDSPDIFTRKAREMSDTLASFKEKLFDLTLPMTSMFSGYRFNLGIQKSFGNTRIQDLVLNFFCVSVDIQKRAQVVHTKGKLWKFVRASMSLTGYLPPISENGSLLVDGGYLNVVPADVMRHQMRARTVIAVDVSPQTERNYYEYGTHLSGWWLLWNSWNPFVTTVNVPSMGDISDTLRWVSSDQHRKQVVNDADLYLTPPVGGYGTLEYDKFDEIIDVSYQYAKPIVDAWVKQNPWIVSGPPRRDVVEAAKPVQGLRRSKSVS